MQEGPSMLSLAVAGLYALVALACILAAATAGRQGQMSWHWRTWALVAVLFILLAVLRVLAVEDALREHLRMMLYMEGTYEERRSFQRPIVASVVVVGATLAAWWFFQIARSIRGRRNIVTMIARVCAAVMMLLLTLRLISLHAIDAALYGPAKLNWIIDIGATLLALGCALAYWRIVGCRN